MPKAKRLATVRARIAVLVDSKGGWTAYGDHYGRTEQELEMLFGEGTEPVAKTYQIVWVEGDVPVPRELGAIPASRVTPGRILRRPEARRRAK